FKDNSFDLCCSLESITKFLLKDKEVFEQAISEALRVLKDGGQLILQPWANKRISFGWTEQEFKNAKSYKHFLENHRIPHKLEQFS
ncbi:MAG: methyltransferase domain-containing protein, partial [Candidatus Daviesbacteria bacterium]